jgi:hypothetical protein
MNIYVIMTMADNVSLQQNREALAPGSSGIEVEVPPACRW